MMFSSKTMATAHVRGTKKILDGTLLAPKESKALEPDTADTAAVTADKEAKMKARKASIVAFNDLMTASNNDVKFFNKVNDSTTTDFPVVVQERRGLRSAKSLCPQKKKTRRQWQQSITMPPSTAPR